MNCLVHSAKVILIVLCLVHIICAKMMELIRKIKFFWSKTNRWHRIFFLLLLAELEWIPRSIKLGFTCNDPALSHPFTGDTISWKWLLLLSITVPYIVILLVELTNHSTNIEKSRKQAWKWYKEYIFSLALNLTILAVTKGIVGEPRPHFFDSCNPKEALTCQDSEYVPRYTCLKQHWVEQSNRSFPSGHACLSFHAANVTVWYLRRRMRTSGAWVLLATAVFFTSATFCSVSRVTDHRHHWWDVLTGVCIAVPMSLFTIFYLCNNFATASGKRESNLRERNIRSKGMLETAAS